MNLVSFDSNGVMSALTTTLLTQKAKQGIDDIG